MPAMPHKHENGCARYNFADWLGHVCPDVLWYRIEDVGSYQGRVYGVGRYLGKVLIYLDWYGSCSDCGAWGEGGEPETQEEALKNSKTFDSPEEAFEYLKKKADFEKPDFDKMREAIYEASK